jgi:hypothetical protein
MAARGICKQPVARRPMLEIHPRLFDFIFSPKTVENFQSG